MARSVLAGTPRAASMPVCLSQVGQIQPAHRRGWNDAVRYTVLHEPAGKQVASVSSTDANSDRQVERCGRTWTRRGQAPACRSSSSRRAYRAYHWRRLRDMQVISAGEPHGPGRPELALLHKSHVRRTSHPWLPPLARRPRSRAGCRWAHPLRGGEGQLLLLLCRGRAVNVRQRTGQLTSGRIKERR